MQVCETLADPLSSRRNCLTSCPEVINFLLKSLLEKRRPINLKELIKMVALGLVFIIIDLLDQDWSRSVGGSISDQSLMYLAVGRSQDKSGSIQPADGVRDACCISAITMCSSNMQAEFDVQLRITTKQQLQQLVHQWGWHSRPAVSDFVYTLFWVVRSQKSTLGTIGGRPVRPSASRRLNNDSRPDSFFELVGVPQLIFDWPTNSDCRNDSRLRPSFGSFWTRFPVDLVHGDRCWPWYCAGDLKVIIVKGHRWASRKNGTYDNSQWRSWLNSSFL